MTILLIGNGFDLEHGLPTTYNDFLNFCDRVRLLTDPQIPPLDRTGLLNRNQTDPRIQALLNGSGPVLEELKGLLCPNVWVSYFLQRRTSAGENWIDFESEISKLIQTLDAALQGRPANQLTRDQIGVLGALSQAARNNRAEWTRIIDSGDSIREMNQRLQKDLDRMVRALELYIAGFVNRLEVKTLSRDIQALNPDRVLSFNYSNTYERVYGQGRDIQYDYIHGKADISGGPDAGRLVLGIDEYLDDQRKNRDLEFLPFKKYYQRIYKDTDSCYADWLQNIRDGEDRYQRRLRFAAEGRADPVYSNPTQQVYRRPEDITRKQHTLYVFGHSLDVTDRDVLQALICAGGVKTRVFYHRRAPGDRHTLDQLIRNLIRVIGQDELVSRYKGSDKALTFLPQSLPGESGA